MDMTSTAAQLILEVLDENQQNQNVFTAYDITVAARGKTNEKVDHNDVRNLIENEFITQQMTGYDRELCTLNIGGNPQAQVYFPDSKSASEHALVSGSPASSPASSPSISSTVSSSVASPAASSTDVDYYLTADNRVNIPQKMLGQISQQGGSYDIMVDGTLKSTRPHSDGRVRVSVRTLGVTGSKVKLSVDVANDTINIESV